MVYAFIVNPAAGTGYAMKTMDRLKARLDTEGVQYTVYYTKKRGHATEIASILAADNCTDVVVAVGGDGTAGEVAAGMKGTGKPMGIIPAGTGNDYIKAACIPNDPDLALSCLLHGKAGSVDT